MVPWRWCDSYTTILFPATHLYAGYDFISQFKQMPYRWSQKGNKNQLKNFLIKTCGNIFHSERLLKSALTRWSQEKWLNVNCLLCYTLSKTEWTEVPENFGYFWSFLTPSCSSFKWTPAPQTHIVTQWSNPYKGAYIICSMVRPWGFCKILPEDLMWLVYPRILSVYGHTRTQFFPFSSSVQAVFRTGTYYKEKRWHVGVA